MSGGLRAAALVLALSFTGCGETTVLYGYAGYWDETGDFHDAEGPVWTVVLDDGGDAPRLANPVDGEFVFRAVPGGTYAITLMPDWVDRYPDCWDFKSPVTVTVTGEDAVTGGGGSVQHPLPPLGAQSGRSGLYAHVAGQVLC